MTEILRRGLRFALVGIANTLIGLFIIYAAMYAGAGIVVANVTGYAVGLAVSFVLNRVWTFQNREAVGAVLPRYFAVVCAAYASNLVAVLAVHHYAHINAYGAQAVGTICYSAATFLGCHLWVFSGKSMPADGASSG